MTFGAEDQRHPTAKSQRAQRQEKAERKTARFPVFSPFTSTFFQMIMANNLNRTFGITRHF
jgi:hypothetical protein